ncbi:Aminotransferase OS=Streptomyces microflavus OX=1919 GN=Smic_36250 PE=4 SV=1 [Streptomyces microflavus]
MEPGDEVIAFEPYYDSYAACIAMAGGVRVPLTLRAPSFPPGPRRTARPDHPADPPAAAQLAAQPDRRGPRPGGSWTGIAALAVEHDLLVVTDEVYEHLVFEGSRRPIAALPGMRERTVSISSAGKTFSYTGWKIGWVTGDSALVTAVRSAKQYLTFVSGGPFQYAIAEALRLPDTFFTEFRESMRRRRDLLAEGLRSAGFRVYEPEGTYFITTDISPFGEEDAYAFCRALPERCGVAAVPVSVFYDDPEAGRSQVRFTFCKREDVLEEAVERLRRLG